MKLTPERWQEVKEVLASALDLDGTTRAEFLDQRCRDDQLLRKEVELLLGQQGDRSTEFLNETFLGQSAVTLLYGSENPWIGRRVGAYQIVEQIGVGGMGEVYRAFRADDQYRKEVALKVIRPGQDSNFVVARFKNERQVLASLDHANIARILDGGTTEDGLPYFVMELIAGEPLVEYCDHRKLATEDRLKLFLQVCTAVQYAHQRLIVHRDLKPSNILVTNDGIPMLLDFGIAKILDSNNNSPGAEPTISIFRLLTPSYASPEQIKGGTITTASDVYSLGVVLYELLSGHRPYQIDSRSPHDIARAVCEFEPERPSSALRKKASSEPEKGTTDITPDSVSAARGDSPERLSRALRGDLDNIVLKALRKEPETRYSSVEQFAADVSRHLGNLPVSASRGTGRYRAGKFIRRHKTGVIAASLIILVLLSGLAAVLYEVRVARLERARADQRFRDMRELARSNLFEFHDAIQNLPGSASARNLVIQRALGYLDKLSHDEGADRELMDELAAGYERVASLQENFSGPGIGDLGAAAASYGKAFAIRDALVATSSDDVAALKAECNLLDGYVIALQESGKTADALRLARRGLALAEMLKVQRPADPETIKDEAEAHLHLAFVMGGNGSATSTRELPAAIQYDRDALKLLSGLQATNQDPSLLRALLRTSWALAYHLRKNRQFDESLEAHNKIWSMSNDLHAFPARWQFLLYNSRSRLFEDMRDNRRAYHDARAALAIAEAMLKAEPHDLNAQINDALALGNLGIDEARMGNKAAGKEKMDKAIGIGERLLAANPQELFYQDLLLIGQSFEGEILSSMGNQPEAQLKYMQALNIATKLAQNDSQDLDSTLNIAKLHLALAIVRARARQYPEAERELGLGLSQLGEFLKIRPDDADAIYVSEGARSALSSLGACVPAQPCKAIEVMQLPILNN